MNLLSQFKIYIYRNRRYNSHEQSLKRLVINKGHNKTEFYNNNWRKVYYDVDTLFESYIEEKETNIFREMHRNEFFTTGKKYKYWQCKYFRNPR